MWLGKVLVLFGILGLSQAQKCPCHCDGSDRMNCANLNWKNIPSSIPDFVTVINFQVNKVTSIAANTFQHLSKVTLLRLDNNKIVKIESKGFRGLTTLNQLVLTNNKIREFDESMLDPRSPLREGISLGSNNLRTFPINVLKKFKVPIAVQNNKIDCDCFAVIPDKLKKFVSGKCHSPKNVKGVQIKDVTYDDVGCSACAREDKCGQHGTCYVDDSKAKCRCFVGYSGESCTVGDEDIGPDEEKITEKGTAQSSDFDFEITSDIYITRSTRTGNVLLLRGCNVKTQAPSNSFNTYYIQDDVTKIKINKQKLNGSDNEYQMDELRLTKVSPSDHGLYKCAIEFNGRLDHLNSKAVFVNLKDVAETRFKMVKKEADDEKQSSEVQTKVESLVEDLKLGKQAIIVQPKTSLFGSSKDRFWHMKVLYKNLTRAARVDYCVKLSGLSSKLNTQDGEQVVAMDCCVGVQDDYAVNRHQWRSAFVGKTIKVRCRKGYNLQKTCKQNPLTGPHWTSKHQCQEAPLLPTSSEDLTNPTSVPDKTTESFTKSIMSKPPRKKTGKTKLDNIVLQSLTTD